METALWMVGLAAAVFVGWWILKIVLAYTVSPERSGREVLKQALVRHGVDIGKIPPSALDEIVQHAMSAARGMAAFSSNPNDKNWRANLVRQLQAEAGSAAEAIRGGPDRMPLKTAEILIKYGVIQKT